MSNITNFIHKLLVKMLAPATSDEAKRKYARNGVQYKKADFSTSKYSPHQGKKECDRRVAQGIAG